MTTPSKKFFQNTVTPHRGTPASYTTRPFPCPPDWKVNNGFRAVLGPDIQGPILEKPGLESRVFTNQLIQGTIEKPLHEIVKHIEDLSNPLAFPNGQTNGEQKWANVLNRIADAVEVFTKKSAKRRWTTSCLAAPVKEFGAHRKPNLGLLPLDLDLWDGKTLKETKGNRSIASMFHSPGQEKINTRKSERGVNGFQAVHKFIFFNSLKFSDAAE